MKLCVLLFFLSFFLSFGCTTMHYTSTGEIPVYAHRNLEKVIPVVVEGERRFYLWGTTPSRQEVYLDREFAGQGMLAVTHLEIDEYQSAKNLFLTMLSFGMYTPVNYRLVAVGVKAGH